jgi:hypothetical protein
VGTQLSDKDEVLHMEQQSTWEIYSSILASVRYIMNVHLSNFPNRIQIWLIGSSHQTLIEPWGDLKEHDDLISW